MIVNILVTTLKRMRLGRTGLMVSKLGFGGIPIQRPPLDEAIRVMHRAFELGINFVDTSIAYGDSEIRIGQALKGYREKVHVATKGSWSSQEATRRTMKESLKRLEVDYIDLWQFHNIRDIPAFEAVVAPGGAFEAAQEALESGIIKHLGFSTHNIDVAIRGVESGLFETVMYPFDFIAREAQEKLIPLAEKHDVGFISMKPFAGGNIRDANLALKFILQFSNVLLLPGMEKLSEVEENIGVVEGIWEISVEERKRMDEIRSNMGSRFCRQCMYCMPCPFGVEIWLLTYMKNLYRLWPKEQIVTGRFDDAAKTGALCTKCGLCETRCPYELPIREIIDENMLFHEQMKKEN